VTLVSWDLSISLILVIESFVLAVLFSVVFLPVGDLASWVSNMLASTASIFDIIHVALIIILGANAWHRGSIKLHVFRLGLLIEVIEALSILLSSNVSSFLTKEAAICRQVVSLIIMRAPKLKVGAFITWDLVTLAFSLMELSEVKSDH
jgi:cytochrome c biogenesis protein CcdA